MAVLNSTLRLTLLDQVSSRARHIGGALDTLQRRQTSFMAPFQSGMGALLAAGGAYLGASHGLDATVGSAIKFESAFADVKKVVDATDEQFENMARTIRQMSTELPLTAVDIAALFAAAGESGVATNDLKTFAEMAARVGIAFDMSAGEAGESLAKLKTQLGLTVAETGDMADAINHLSNNMASKAKDVTDFMLRVGALAEMGGFTKEQIAGIGSAMIAAGAQAETAGTAMQNVVKALTRGASAKKAQREAAKALGLDLPAIAKEMQKDAPKAMKKVLTAISKQSKDRHLSLLSDFFGDEAKAFAPLIGNIGLLDQALDSVADKTNYAGSAFREYVARASTVENAILILRNKLGFYFEDLGKEWLPTIKEGIAGIGHVLDTLGERATIFDKVGTAMEAFTQGLGYDGGIREIIEDLGDLLLGPADGSAAADELGRIFMQAKEWGASLRELSDAVRDNPVAKFLSELAPYGFKLMLWSTGILMLAGTIRKLASALMFLSGASALVGALKTAGTIAGVVLPEGKAPTGKPPTKLPPVAPISLPLAGITATTGLMLYGKHLNETDPTWIERQKKADEHTAQNLGWLKSFFVSDGADNYSGSEDQLAAQRGVGYTPLMQAVDQAPIRLDNGSIAELLKPSGTQDVRVTNPQPPPPINLTVNQTVIGVSDPLAAADAAAARIGKEVNTALESAWSK